jgi:hypothetical protein
MNGFSLVARFDGEFSDETRSLAAKHRKMEMRNIEQLALCIGSKHRPGCRPVACGLLSSSDVVGVVGRFAFGPTTDVTRCVKH